MSRGASSESLRERIERVLGDEIEVVPYNPEWRDAFLAERARLPIQNPEVANAYGELKTRLRREHRGDRVAYTRGRAAVAEEVTARATRHREGA